MTRKGAIVVLIIVVLMIFSIDPIMNRIVLPALVDAIKGDNGLKLSIHDARYSLFRNTVTVRNADFTAVDSSLHGRDTVTVLIPYGSFGGINWFGLLLQREITCGEITLKQSQIHVARHRSGSDADSSATGNDSTATTLKQTFAALIPGGKLSIGLLSVDSATITGISYEENTITSDSIACLKATISGIHVAPDDEADLYDTYMIEAIGFHRRFLTSGYDLSTGLIAATNNPPSLTIDSLIFQPFVSDQVFFERRDYRDDRWIVRIPHIHCSNADVSELFAKRRISADQISVDNFHIESFTNKRLPLNPRADPKMPNEILASLDVFIEIRECRVRNSLFILESLVPNVPRRARLTFTDINADISPISNTTTTRTLQDPCVIDASARLMGEGRLHVRLVYPLLTDKLSFACQGSLGRMAAGAINSHLEVEDQTRIASGMIDSISFRSDVVDGIATVNIVPLYHNLTIATLDETGTDERSIASFIANTFVIRESNPSEDGTISTGVVTYAKKSGDAFLDVIWLALLRGLGRVVGFSG